MIIEGDKTYSDMLSKKIIELGCEAFQVFDAKEAKKFLLEDKIQPVLVLCSANLPDCSGVNFFRETLVRNLNLNICMLINKIERLELLEAVQLGVVDFMSRSVRPSFYSEKLSSLVRLGQSRAAKKNVLAQNNSHTKAEQIVSAMKLQNIQKKPA